MSDSVAWPAVLACVVAVAATAWLRLHVYPGYIVPIGYGMPLCLFLWARDRRLMWLTVVLFACLSAFHLFIILPRADPHSVWLAHQKSALLWVLLDLLIIATVVHVLIGARQRLDTTVSRLKTANQRLADREAHIISQNSKLQSQTDELQHQSEALRLTNESLSHRETMLQTLLDLSRSLPVGLGEEETMSRICQSLGELVNGPGTAAAITLLEGDQAVVRSHSGFGAAGIVRDGIPRDRSLAGRVIALGHTLSIVDLAQEKDLEVPQPVKGDRIDSALATGLVAAGRPIGTLEVYFRRPRQWSAQQIAMVESLAAQASTTLAGGRLFRELESRRREAEEANVRKSRFLAAASHDIRTPANAISLLAELLKRSADSPSLTADIPELAEELRQSASSLVTLVSNVLDVTRFDTDKLELHETEFPLQRLLDEEARQVLPLAQNKKLELDVEPAGEALWLRADRIKLGRVIGNLLGNAIKFTDHGQIRVTPRRGDDGALHITVSDTGIGISAENQERIFDEFWQMSDPNRSKGSGLGLSISKRLMEAMGGSLRVASETGQGSAFTLTLPDGAVFARPESDVLTTRG